MQQKAHPDVTFQTSRMGYKNLNLSLNLELKQAQVRLLRPTSAREVELAGRARHQA